MEKDILSKLEVARLIALQRLGILPESEERRLSAWMERDEKTRPFMNNYAKNHSTKMRLHHPRQKVGIYSRKNIVPGERLPGHSGYTLSTIWWQALPFWFLP